MALVETNQNDYLARLIAEKEEELGYPICGARNRQGTPCTNKAGKGVQGMLGVKGVRCKHHGGRNQLPTAKNYRHGQFAKVNSEHPELNEMMQKIAEDHEVFNLEKEIIRMRAIMEMLAKKGDLLGSLKAALDVSKVVERYNLILEGRKYVISIENVADLRQYVIDVINRHVTDPVQRHAIAEDLKRYRVNSISRVRAIEGEYEEVDGGEE